MTVAGQTGTIADLDALGRSGKAMFVWLPAAASITWANAAGCALWGAGSLAQLVQRQFDRSMPAVAQLQKLELVLADGAEDKQALVFWMPEASRTLHCNCRKIRLEGGQSALLLQVLDKNQHDSAPALWINGHASLSELAARPRSAPPDLAPQDAATLAEIARMIRQGGGAEPQPQPREEEPAKPPVEPAMGAGQPEYIGRLSHELRTPLNAIIGYGELLQEEKSGPLGSPKYRSYAKDMLEAARHCLSLVNDLYDMTHLAAGNHKPEFSEVDLNEAVRACLGIVAPIAGKAGVTLEEDLSAALPQAILDRRGLRQIIINLLANAIKFTPPGGRVTISTVYRTGIGVELSVQDTGQGMSAGDLTAARGASEGAASGLGLPISRAIATANGGTLQLASEPGSGTRVSLFLPMSRLLLR